MDVEDREETYLLCGASTTHKLKFTQSVGVTTNFGTAWNLLEGESVLIVEGHPLTEHEGFESRKVISKRLAAFNDWLVA